VNDADSENTGLAAKVTGLLKCGVDERVFPGAAAAVAFGSDRCCVAVGRETYSTSAPATTTDAIFDVASLTKVVATTTAIMQLVEEGALSLEDRAAQFLPGLNQDRKKEITIRQLLTHTAGFPGPYEFYRFCRTREQLIEAIYSLELVYRPGDRRLYDDVSFMLLALIVEEIVSKSFDRFCEHNIFQPLRMANTGFRPQAGELQIVPTEIDPDRGGLLRGIVHDENAYILGGVAGHAGLFSRSLDLLSFASMIVGSEEANCKVLREESIRRMLQCEWRDGEGEYGLGWDRVRPHYMGTIDDPDAIGHTGFTGTSIVISPRRALAIVLLTNRIYPKRSDPAAINSVRRQLVQTVRQSL
jgi:CubicO group peptidase (beta-lactamase class C family)